MRPLASRRLGALMLPCFLLASVGCYRTSRHDDERAYREAAPPPPAPPPPAYGGSGAVEPGNPAYPNQPAPSYNSDPRHDERDPRYDERRDGARQDDDRYRWDR